MYKQRLPRVLAVPPPILTARRRLKLLQQTKVARKLAEYFAYANNWVFEQIKKYNMRRNGRTLDVLKTVQSQLSDINQQRDKIISQLDLHLQSCEVRQSYLTRPNTAAS